MTYRLLTFDKLEMCIILLEQLNSVFTITPLPNKQVTDSVFRRTLLGYYAEGMHANFK